MQAINSETFLALKENVNIGIIIAVDGLHDETLLDESNIITGTFKLQRSFVSGGVIEIGSSETSQVEFEIDNEDGSFDDFIFEGSVLDISLQIPNIAGTAFETLTIGKFIVDNQPKQETTISIIALDYMAKFNKDYDTDLTYPATLSQILADACSKCGVTLSTASFTNDSYEVSEKPVTDKLTFHQVVSWVAELAGCNAWIGYLGQLKLSWYGENQGTADIEIDATDRWSYEAEESNVTITGLFAKVNDVEYSTGTDNYRLSIEENGLLQDTPQTVIDAIHTKINAFSYRPLKMATKGYPHLWPGDKLTKVTAPNGDIFISCITNISYVLNANSVIEAVGESQQLFGYASAAPFTSSQKSILKKLAEIEASEAVGDLEQQTLALNSIIANSAGLYLTVLTDELTEAKTLYIHDSATLEGSDVIYTMTSSGFAWTNAGWNAGNPSWTYGYTQDGNAVFHLLSTVGINADWINAGSIDTDVIYVGSETLTTALANMQTQITGLASGSSNFLFNSTWGTYDNPADNFWGEGMTWEIFEKRGVDWNTLESSITDWDDFESGDW